MTDELDALDDTVEARLATLERATTRTLEQNPRSTIEPPRRAQVDTGGQRAVEMLARLRKSGAGVGADGALELQETLGEGGMGVVHLAEQVALGRKVAVKTLRPEHREQATKIKLLREAWVTGGLEHPNVVPVYDVGLDDEGLPVIVLKRIEGTQWGELMGDAERVRELFGATDLLEWNLQILMQVCNAVHFAHSRGIVHRDIKPENVMIGEFGEVYLLDWGIAVSLQDDGSGRLPLASQATEMAGTPCYMAPEMLGGEQPGLTERTDVYLLGATLFEIVGGEPPHRGESPMQLVRSVVVSEPELPADTPAELARICRRAMAAEPEARFESAEQLRLALQGFLQHRGSARLAELASERLAELEREVQREAADAAARASSPEAEQVAEAEQREQREQRLYNLFGECRFGFRQALSDWPDNEAARAGLQRAIETMVRHELNQGDPKAATRLLGELEEPSSELAQQVEQARREEEARREELEELGRAFDPNVGKRTRTFFGVLFGSIWTLSPMVAGLFLTEHSGSLRMFQGATVAFLALAVAFGVWARESLSKTLINQRIFKTVILFLVAQLGLLAACELLGLEAIVARTLSIFLWGVVTAMVAVFLDPRFGVVSVGYFAAFFATAHWPDVYYWTTAAANLNLTIFVVLFSRNLPRYVGAYDPIKRLHGRIVSRSRSAR